MGRNSIPKLFEWRDGVLYRFRSSSGKDLQANSGDMIVYERDIAGGETEVLATAWADGLTEVMTAMFEAGQCKGYNKGYAKAQTDIRRSLGITAQSDDASRKRGE